ncbi:hypothetical protein EDB81DRAFT_459398 [Dactylonectria macrodidyma]|uniref:Secreted protein n=1 Tax=Dactylonectria macrodidyma TaxID=307937 RepID=A0A9P9EY06_9HYPO|nr:hypothetical protein EDB81DRAFT_459398 [Dactylonectria macrodidyma]
MTNIVLSLFFFFFFFFRLVDNQGETGVGQRTICSVENPKSTRSGRRKKRVKEHPGLSSWSFHFSHFLFNVDGVRLRLGRRLVCATRRNAPHGQGTDRAEALR